MSVGYNLDPIFWAFEHFYHMDKANAAIHMAPVKFSPITFNLCQALENMWQTPDEPHTREMEEVQTHYGQYELDPGR